MTNTQKNNNNNNNNNDDDDDINNNNNNNIIIKQLKDFSYEFLFHAILYIYFNHFAINGRLHHTLDTTLACVWI